MAYTATMVYPEKIESIYCEVQEPAKTSGRKFYIVSAVAALALATLSVGLTFLILSGAFSEKRQETEWSARAEQLIEQPQPPMVPVPLPRVNSFVVISKQPQAQIMHQRKPISLRQLSWNHRSRQVDSSIEPIAQLPAVNGVFWSDAAERLVPSGFHSRQAMHWRATVKNSNIVDIREGCGRMQNRLVEFNNQVLSCARYRQNNDQIQGELFSFYLAQQLNIPNVVPVVATRPTGKAWTDVTPKVNLANWQSNRPVLLSRFIDGLEPAYIPELLREKNRHLHPSDVKNLNRDQVTELVQWSDLIVFDYLTANLDRVVNNMYNLQWNPGMMASPAHNLLKDPNTGLLVFLDNESGLVHGYRLLDKYNVYHKSLLQSLCIFRKSTVQSVRQLLKLSPDDLSKLFLKAFESNSPGMDGYLPFLPQRSIDTLRQRLKQIEEQVEKCEAQYTLL